MLPHSLLSTILRYGTTRICTVYELVQISGCVRIRVYSAVTAYLMQTLLTLQRLAAASIREGSACSSAALACAAGATA
eukprot:13232-Heterococcus_DN1.PRE.5